MADLKKWADKKLGKKEQKETQRKQAYDTAMSKRNQAMGEETAGNYDKALALHKEAKDLFVQAGERTGAGQSQLAIDKLNREEHPGQKNHADVKSKEDDKREYQALLVKFQNAMSDRDFANAKSSLDRLDVLETKVGGSKMNSAFRRRSYEAATKK